MTTSAATQDNNLASPQRHHQQQNNDFDLAVIDASNSCQAHGGDENANGGAARSGSAVSVHRARSSSTLQAATDSAVPLPLRTLLILEDAHPAAKVSTAPTPAGGHTRGTVSMRRGGDTEVDMNEHNTDSSQVCRAISPSTLNPKGRVPLESPAFSCPPSTAAPPLPVGRAARSTNAPCHPSTTTTSTATPQRPDEPLDLGVKGAVDRGSGNKRSSLPSRPKAGEDGGSARGTKAELTAGEGSLCRRDVEAKTVYKRTSPAQRAHDVPSTAPAALATQPRSSASSPFPAVAAAATATGLAVSRPPTSSMTARRVSAFQPSGAAGHSVGRTTVAPTVDDARSPASDSKSPRGAEDVSGPRPSGKECGEALPRGLPVSIETPHFLQLVPGEQAGHQGSEESDSTTPTDTNSAPILPPPTTASFAEAVWGTRRAAAPATPTTATDNTSLFSDDDHDNGQDSDCVTAAASPSVYYSFHQQPRQLKAPGVPGAGLSSTTTVTDTTARVSPRSPFVSPLTAVVAAESGGSAAAAAFPSSAATTDACLRGRRSVSQSVIIAAWNRMGARTGAPVSGVGAGGGHNGGVESPEPSAEALQMSFALRKSLAVAGDSIGGGDELATSAVPASRDTQLARVPTGAAAEVATGKASFFRHQCTVAGHQEAGSRGSSRRSWASVASMLPIRRRSVVTRQREPPALFSPSPENSEPSDAVPQPFSALGQLSIREGAPAAGHPASPPTPTKAANDIAHSWVAAPPQELHRPPRARIKYKKEAPSADRALPLMREPPASLRTSTATSTSIATQWPSSQESRGSDTSLSTMQSLQAGILVPVNGEDRSGGGLVEERERLSVRRTTAYDEEMGSATATTVDADEEDRANEEGGAAERQAAPRSPQSLAQHQLQRQPIEEHPHRASAPGFTTTHTTVAANSAAPGLLLAHDNDQQHYSPPHCMGSGTFFAPSTCGAAACGAILWVHSSPSSPRSYSTSDSRLEVARDAQDVEDEEDSIDEVGLRRTRDGEDARCRLHRSGDEHAKHFVGLDASPFNRNYSSPSVFAYRSDSTGFNAMTAATRGGGGAKRAALVRSSSHQLLSRRSQSEPTRNTSLLSSTARVMPRWRERLTPTPQPTSLLSSSTARDDVDGTASGLLSAPRGRRGLTSQGAPPLAHQPSAHLHPPPPPTSALPSHVPQYLRREISGSLGSVRWQEVSLHASCPVSGAVGEDTGDDGDDTFLCLESSEAPTWGMATGEARSGGRHCLRLPQRHRWCRSVTPPSASTQLPTQQPQESCNVGRASREFDPSTPSEQGIPPSRTGTRTFADAIVRLPQTRYEPPMPSNRNTFTAFVHLSDISSSQLLATAAATFQCGFDAHLRGVSSGVHAIADTLILNGYAFQEAHLADGSGVGADVVDAAGGALPISPLNSSLGTAPTDHISRVDTPVLVAVHGAVARRTPLSEEAEAASARSESPDALSCVTPPKLRSVTKAPRGLNHAAAAVAAAAVGLDGSSGGFDGDNDAGSDDLSVPAAQPGATSPRTSWSLESMRAGGAPVSEGERHALSDEERPWLDAFGHSTPLLHSVADAVVAVEAPATVDSRLQHSAPLSTSQSLPWWNRHRHTTRSEGSDTMDFSQRGGESGNGGGGHSPYSSVSVNSALVVVPGGRAASLASPATPTGSVAITGPPLGHTLHPGGGAVASVSFWMSGCRLRREAHGAAGAALRHNPNNEVLVMQGRSCDAGDSSSEKRVAGEAGIEAGAAPVAKHTSHDHDGDNAGLSDACMQTRKRHPWMPVFPSSSRSAKTALTAGTACAEFDSKGMLATTAPTHAMATITVVPPTLSFIEEAEVQSTCNASPLALAIAATSGGPYRGEGEPTPDKEALDDGVDGDERSGVDVLIPLPLGVQAHHSRRASSVSNTIAAPTNTAVTAALDGLGETETYARTCIEESAADARDAGVSVRDTLQTQHGQPPLQQQCSPTTAPFALPSALPGMGMVESGASHAIEGFAAGAGRDSGSCGGSGTTGVAVSGRNAASMPTALRAATSLAVLTSRESCDSLVPPSQTAVTGAHAAEDGDVHDGRVAAHTDPGLEAEHELPHSPLATKLIGSDLMAEPHATSHRRVDIRSAGLAVGVDQRDTSLGEQIPLTVPQNSPEPSQPTASCTVGPPGSPDHVLARSPLLLGEEASVDTRAASRAQTRPDHHYGLVVSPSPHHEGSTPRVRAQSRSQRQHRGPSVGQVVCRWCGEPYTNTDVCLAARRPHSVLREERRIEKAAKRTAQTLLREGRVTEAVALLKSAGVYVQ
ncbi:hypothetical protein CGC21_34170 [Leishmania donovani]|uniref:Uncharacterized protein n=1 Tax=Leishmania donovani TaxID=5661 RepID=A0A504XKG3_LEIDO|nr:hypothetical protein CGC21_34170 [Leishmania donovani]